MKHRSLSTDSYCHKERGNISEKFINKAKTSNPTPSSTKGCNRVKNQDPPIQPQIIIEENKEVISPREKPHKKLFDYIPSINISKIKNHDPSLDSARESSSHRKKSYSITFHSSEKSTPKKLSPKDGPYSKESPKYSSKESLKLSPKESPKLFTDESIGSPKLFTDESIGLQLKLFPKELPEESLELQLKHIDRPIVHLSIESDIVSLPRKLIIDEYHKNKHIIFDIDDMNEYKHFQLSLVYDVFKCNGIDYEINSYDLVMNNYSSILIYYDGISYLPREEIKNIEDIKIYLCFSKKWTDPISFPMHIKCMHDKLKLIDFVDICYKLINYIEKFIGST